MLYQVNGFKDIHTVLSNERKMGGAVEADLIRLRTGEEFTNIVVSHIDTAGSIIYSVSFVTEDGSRFMIHVNDISMISQPTHKFIKDLMNPVYKKWKIEEKVKFLKKLCRLNEGFYTKPFIEEVTQIITDLGIDVAREHVDAELLDRFYEKQKVVPLEKRVS